jgi:hypothetical protein
MDKQLLEDIKQFIARTNMGPSYFGKASCGNSELIRRLEAGGSVTLRTMERVRDYMARNSSVQRNIQRFEYVETKAGLE